MMAMLNSASSICVKSELDLFSVPPTQTSIVHGTMVESHPIAFIVDAGPVEFNIPVSGEDIWIFQYLPKFESENCSLMELQQLWIQ